MNNEELINLITKEVMRRLEAILSENKKPFVQTACHDEPECQLQDCVDFTNKRLVSEIDLKNISKMGITKISVSKKTIVTPLALDYARINRLQIHKL